MNYLAARARALAAEAYADLAELDAEDTPIGRLMVAKAREMRRLAKAHGALAADLEAREAGDPLSLELRRLT